MDLKNYRILIVEDDFLIAMDLAETVREAGAEVVGPAASVDEALELLSSHQITVAILDINLGKYLSLKVAQTLHREQIPFIYHSGQIARLNAPEWPEAPIISKPAIPTVLTAAIADTVKKRSG